MHESHSCTVCGRPACGPRSSNCGHTFHLCGRCDLAAGTDGFFRAAVAFLKGM